MINTIKALKKTCFYIVTALFFSCEQEDISTSQNEVVQLLPIKIMTTNNSQGNGSLLVNNTTHHELPYNETIEIRANLTESVYTFSIEDATNGIIKISATKAELEQATLEQPFILTFEHYKKEEIAVFTVFSSDEGSFKNFIDLAIHQPNQSLYYIDWGDQTHDVAESAEQGIEANARVVHRYQNSGEYTITISTTNGAEVSAIDLQITANGKGDKIKSLNLKNMPNLTYLRLGDSHMESIDDVIAQYPKLEFLSARFGNLSAIDLSNNPMLETLNIAGNYQTKIKGISNLVHLNSLNFHGEVDNLSPALYPELTRLGVYGNKMNTIDISQNPKLKSLTLQSNELQRIDLSNNENLNGVYIVNNKLTEIDLSQNPNIEHLRLFGNYINELDISQQKKLINLNLSSVHFKHVTVPENLDFLEVLDLTAARFLNEESLLDAVFKGHENKPKKKGHITFNEYATVLERQLVPLQRLKENFDWYINIPE